MKSEDVPSEAPMPAGNGIRLALRAFTGGALFDAGLAREETENSFLTTGELALDRT